MSIIQSTLMINKKFIFLLATILSTFVSCKTKDELAYQYQPPTKEEEIIEEHLIDNNIEALIDDCIRYPNYNNQIANYLLYDIDYSDADYSLLLQYQHHAKHDSILKSGYEILVSKKEEQILSNISEMSLSEVANYYKNHTSEQIFLRPILCNAFTKIIDTLQYTEIKTIYNTFSTTDIGDSLAPHYIEAREIIRTKITKSISDYGEIEKNLKDYYLEKTKEELNLYIANSIEPFIEDLFGKDLPRKKEKVENRFNTSFDKNFSKYQMANIVNSNIKELVSIINAGRSSFIEGLSETTVESTLYYIPDIDNYIKTDYTKRENLAELYTISEIQNRVDWKGLVLGAASLFTGGWAGLALTVLDIHHGVKNVKGKAAEALPYIRSFISKTQDYLEDMSNYYITNGYYTYDSKNSTATKSFKKIAYEIY